MITPPDETYSTAEAASLIGVSERQCARYLADGLIRAQRPNGRWRVTAIALWQYLGIDQEMMRLWLDYCSRPLAEAPSASADGPETSEEKSMG